MATWVMPSICGIFLPFISFIMTILNDDAYVATSFFIFKIMKLVFAFGINIPQIARPIVPHWPLWHPILSFLLIYGLRRHHMLTRLMPLVWPHLRAVFFDMTLNLDIHGTLSRRILSTFAFFSHDQLLQSKTILLQACFYMKFMAIYRNCQDWH